VRELHVVSVTEDGRHVVLAGKAGATKGGFRVALDDRLSAAVRGDLPRPGEPDRGQLITPRDIQSRLRSGESAEQIALSAGVPVSRVERFSGPVQGEMARIIDAARECHLVRGRLGRSVVPMGVSVDSVLALTPSYEPERTQWATRREDDGSWLVTVSWYARARTRTASWSYEPTNRTLTALDPASAALGHRDTEELVRPRATVRAAKPATRRAAPKKPAAKKAAAKKAAPKKPAAKKPAPKKTPAKKAPAKKSAVKKAPATKAPAKKAPAKKAPVKKVPAKKAPTRMSSAKAPAKKATVTKAPASRRTGGRVLRAVPDPAPRAKKAAKPAKARASVPGWADVLLGTSPGDDT
jgi:hypothetical protein